MADTVVTLDHAETLRVECDGQVIKVDQYREGETKVAVLECVDKAGF